MTDERQWERLAQRPPPPSPEETLEVGEAQAPWHPGNGHRVQKVGPSWVCVVCGDHKAEWPDGPCAGPSGVAL